MFVAVDAELNREVALKEILEHHAFDSASRRGSCWKRRSPAASNTRESCRSTGWERLPMSDHYAMRFIRGDSLKGGRLQRFMRIPG